MEKTGAGLEPGAEGRFRFPGTSIDLRGQGSFRSFLWLGLLSHFENFDWTLLCSSPAYLRMGRVENHQRHPHSKVCRARHLKQVYGILGGVASMFGH